MLPGALRATPSSRATSSAGTSVRLEWVERRIRPEVRRRGCNLLHELTCVAIVGHGGELDRCAGVGDVSEGHALSVARNAVAAHAASLERRTRCGELRIGARCDVEHVERRRRRLPHVDRRLVDRVGRGGERVRGARSKLFCRPGGLDRPRYRLIERALDDGRPYIRRHRRLTRADVGVHIERARGREVHIIEVVVGSLRPLHLHRRQVRGEDDAVERIFDCRRVGGIAIVHSDRERGHCARIGAAEKQWPRGLDLQRCARRQAAERRVNHRRATDAAERDDASAHRHGDEPLVRAPLGLRRDVRAHVTLCGVQRGVEGDRLGRRDDDGLRIRAWIDRERERSRVTPRGRVCAGVLEEPLAARPTRHDSEQPHAPYDVKLHARIHEQPTCRADARDSCGSRRWRTSVRTARS